MSNNHYNNNYGYYFSYPPNWNNWNSNQYSQQQNYQRNVPPPLPHISTTEPPPPPPPLPPAPVSSYSSHMNNHTRTDIQGPRNQVYQNSGNYYNNRQSGSYRYNSNRHYPYLRSKDQIDGQQNWQDNNFRRQRREQKAKNVKKKRRSLAENPPKSREWSLEDASTALAVEKEFSKLNRNQSLIIKFPDPELNKDIVTKFHPSIENVHFQQPSTARFCFVTLSNDCDPDDVINDLNQIKFGEGYLTAEYKKDREEDQIIEPKDIDPLTLYVGNLAQEVTKEIMVKTFPKCKRIDIGYAKKMKYTRYAFVTFRNVNDSIEAFKNTRCKEMYSKSLIVRFRRLKGTVGMPGETKPHNPPKENPPEEKDENDSAWAKPNEPNFQDGFSVTVRRQLDNENWLEGNILTSGAQKRVVRQPIKIEPIDDNSDDDEDDEIEMKPDLKSLTEDGHHINHRPKIKQEDRSNADTCNVDLSVVKKEPGLDDAVKAPSFSISESNIGNVTVKTEPADSIEFYEHDSDDDFGYEDDEQYNKMLENSIFGDTKSKW